MIILTGGAGFIGSCFLWKLNQEGIDEVIVVDNLDDGSDKKKNLQRKRYRDYIPKDNFIRRIENNDFPKPEFIIHMGACSSTILTDWGYYFKNNFEYSRKLAQWSINQGVPFLYASSAATYGDGRLGYDDSNSVTCKLKPLNMYGKSKHLFDFWVLENGYDSRVTGLKFFNVFGPNEYHKGEMRSVICKSFPQLRDKGRIKLFKSYHKDYKDGEQRRDFIYIKDAIEVMYFFFKNPDKTGIFNLGTGVSRSWNDLARAMFAALDKEPHIDYIEMPEYLKSKYQYLTQARMDKLRKAGCAYQFKTLEDSVKDYIDYLKTGSYL